MRREIRVFISSTFSDMQSERNYLVKHVFPDIERECRRRNVAFTALDLRWGITEEESQSGRVVEICLDEIERTRPFFIGLVGGRYGWVPPKDAANIDVARLCERFPWIADCFEHGLSITEMEMRYGVLDSPKDVEAHFFVRGERSIPAKFRESDADAEDKRRRLVADIRRAAGEGRCTVSDYRSMARLGREVHGRLMETLDRLFPADEKTDIYEQCAARQQQALDELRRVYVPRSGEKTDYLRCQGRFGHAVIRGSAGDGLSAFAANELSDTAIAEAAGESGLPLQVMRTIVGEDVPTQEMARRMFVHRLMRLHPEVEVPEMKEGFDTEIPFADIVRRFPKAEYVWVIDGPEKLADRTERGLGGLLCHTPLIGHFIIITSDRETADNLGVAPGDDTCRGWLTKLHVGQRREIAERYLARAGKRLNGRQLSAVAGSEVLDKVKILRTFVDILTTFGVYENVDDFIHRFATVETIGDFYTQILAYLEEEYGRGRVELYFKRLLASEIGMSEDMLMRGVADTPLERAALEGATEAFTERRNGQVRLVDGLLREAAGERYTVSDSERKSLSRLVIADCRRGRRQLREGAPLWQRIGLRLMRGMPPGNSDAASARWCALTSELCRQYEKTGNYRGLYRIMRHWGIGSLMNGIGVEGAYRIGQLLRDKGYKPWQMFSNLDLVLEHLMFDGAHMIPILWLNFMNPSPEDREEYKRRTGRRWLPRNIKKAVMASLETPGSDRPVTELWDENHPENIGVDAMVTVTAQCENVLPAMVESHVAKLYDKIAKTIDNGGIDPIYLPVFLQAAAACSLRLGRGNDCDMYLRQLRQQKLDKLQQRSIQYLLFMGALHARNRDLDDRQRKIRAEEFMKDVPATVDKNTPGYMQIEQVRLGLAAIDGRAAEAAADLVARYPDYSPDGAAWTAAAVMFNLGRLEAAEAVVKELLRQKLTAQQRGRSLFWLSDIKRRQNDPSKACAALDELEGLLSDRDRDNGDYGLWRIMLQRADIAISAEDEDGLEKAIQALLDYSDSAGVTNGDFLKYTAYLRMGVLYESKMAKAGKDSESRREFTRKRAETYRKVLEYNASIEDIHISNLALYIISVLDLDALEAQPDEMLLGLLKQACEAAKKVNLELSQTIRIALGRLYLRLGMDEEFDQLAMTYPTLVCAERATQTLAACHRNATTATDRALLQQYIMEALMTWLDGIDYSGETRQPLINHVADLLTVTDAESLRRIYSADLEKQPSETNITMMMIMEIVEAHERNFEAVVKIDDEVARALASRRWDDSLYLRYERLRADLKGDCTGQFNDPAARAQGTYLALLGRYNGGDRGAIRMAELKNRARTNVDAAQEIVGAALEAEGPESPTLRGLMREYRKIIENGNIDDWGPCVVFLKTLDETLPQGAPLLTAIADDVCGTVDQMGEYCLRTNICLNAQIWHILESLLAKSGREHSRWMVFLGLYVMDADARRRYYERYTARTGSYDTLLEITYLRRIKYTADFDELCRRLDRLAEAVDPDNDPDNVWPLVITEQCYRYRYAGEYGEAQRWFGKLKEAAERENTLYDKYTDMTFPAELAILAHDADFFLPYGDNLLPGRTTDLLWCSYYLMCDNLPSDARLFETVRYRDEDAEGREAGDLRAFTALRHIEMARYLKRHGGDTAAARRELDEARRLLAMDPESRLYLQNYLKRNEI